MPNTFALYFSQRFLPIFLVQLGGALNDNFFKSLVLITIAFNVDNFTAISINNNLAVLLLIAPAIFLSPLAGQLADRAYKPKMIQMNKVLEIIIAGFATIALYFESTIGMLLVLFALGAQSAMFAPNKYAILPQLMQDHELVVANAQIATATFIALLLGTLLGAYVSTLNNDWWVASGFMFTVAIAGWFAAKCLPATEKGDSTLKIDWHLGKQAWLATKLIRKERSLSRHIIGLGWFWFIATAIFTQLPAYIKFTLQGTETQVTLGIGMLITGIALGSWRAAQAAGKQPEVGLVVPALFSISLLTFGLGWPIPQLSFKYHWLISYFSLFMIGTGLGAFAVTLYSGLQQQTRLQNRARIIATSNLINAVAMVIIASIGLILFGIFLLNIKTYWFFIALLNLAVLMYFGKHEAKATLRYLASITSRFVYRIQCHNLETLPEKHAGLIVCNHVSYADAVIIFGAIRRPIRFVINKDIYEKKAINWIFRAVDCIPICSPLQDRATYRAANQSCIEALSNGELVLIFPEGSLTKDGELNEFKRGMMNILKKQPTLVYPISIHGLWGSFFSHGGIGAALKGLPRCWRHTITLRAGNAIPADEVTPSIAQDAVKNLLT